MVKVEGVQNVLLDIEGTICPISFVKDTLFPYALKALPNVLAAQWDSSAFTPYRDAFPEEYRTSPSALQAHVEDLTKRDVKIAYLKNLQGYLWHEGYRSGAYSTPLFQDVAPQLKQWNDEGVKLAIYSSGSVFAQQLLFQHVQGTTGTEDMRNLMTREGWFDTANAGLKTEATSYTTIVKTLGWQAAQTLFLTDNVNEYDAAVKAKLQALLVDRPGNAVVSEADRARMVVVESLSDITLEPGAKK
ncbi:enolase-phosphatase E1 [Elasticomyces elasticus]|nr:enolase-phosphatase E1 [Elasticomyces elasticus]